jgi:peptidoglycan/LPS O-acetylase OafA/YrhL
MEALVSTLPAQEIAQPSASASGLGRKIPSLDGLRAVSILLVMLAHVNGTANFPSGLPRWLVDHGSLGVQIFFCISGFLITSLLLEERRNTGKISLKLFYARRTLRIFPALYAFLLVTAALCSLRMLVLPAYNYLHAATYTMNYVSHGAWWTGHLWSLSVEEQFYLVWPMLICLAGSRLALTTALWVAITAPVILGALHILRAPVSGNVWQWFPLVADSIASGCILAGALPKLLKNAGVQIALRARAGLLVPGLILCLDCLRPHPGAFFPTGQILVNTGICYCILRFTQFPSDTAGRILNSRPLVWLGVLSYSLYLWQQPFLDRSSHQPWTAFPLNCICALAAAAGSYWLIEKPLLSLRRRFRPT